MEQVIQALQRLNEQFADPSNTVGGGTGDVSTMVNTDDLRTVLDWANAMAAAQPMELGSVTTYRDLRQQGGEEKIIRDTREKE